MLQNDTKKPLTILIDMDDVLENFIETLISSLNFEHNLSVDVNDIKDWDFWGLFPTLDISECFKPVYSHKFWDRLVPLPDAVESVKSLVDGGDKVYVVTAGHPDTAYNRLRFLSKYFPFIPKRNLMVVSEKQLIKGDVLIDDNYNNLLGGDYKKILMTTYHNRDYEVPDGMTRCNCWGEVIEAIDKLR